MSLFKGLVHAFYFSHSFILCIAIYGAFIAFKPYFFVLNLWCKQADKRIEFWKQETNQIPKKSHLFRKNELSSSSPRAVVYKPLMVKMTSTESKIDGLQVLYF